MSASAIPVVSLLSVGDLMCQMHERSLTPVAVNVLVRFGVPAVYINATDLDQACVVVRLLGGDRLVCQYRQQAPTSRTTWSVEADDGSVWRITRERD